MGMVGDKGQAEEIRHDVHPSEVQCTLPQESEALQQRNRY